MINDTHHTGGSQPGGSAPQAPVPESDASHTTIALQQQDPGEHGAHSFARDIAVHLQDLIREPVTAIVYRLNPWHRRVCPAASFTDITVGGHQVRVTAWTTYEGRSTDDTTYAITLDDQTVPFRRLPADELAQQLARTIWLHHLDLPAHEHPHPDRPPEEEQPTVDRQQVLLDAAVALVRQFVPEAARIYLQTGDTLGQGFFLTDIDTRTGRSLTALNPDLMDKLSDDLWPYLNPLSWDGVVAEDDYGVACVTVPDGPIPERATWACLTCGFASEELSADRDQAHLRFDGAHYPNWHTDQDLTGSPSHT